MFGYWVRRLSVTAGLGGSSNSHRHARSNPQTARPESAKTKNVAFLLSRLREARPQVQPNNHNVHPTHRTGVNGGPRIKSLCSPENCNMNLCPRCHTETVPNSHLPKRVGWHQSLPKLSWQRQLSYLPVEATNSVHSRAIPPNDQFSPDAALQDS